MSGSSSFSKKAAIQFTLRKSLTGSWTLIEPVSHITKYHVRTPEAPHGYPAREIRRDSSDGPLLGTVHVKDASGLCQLSFFDGIPNILIAAPRKISIRGRHRFTVEGHKLYWKNDVICRESRTRRICAETDGDTLLIYEDGKMLVDAIVASFIAMKSKRLTSLQKASWFFV
jgi:hypothetical protein